MIDLSLAGMLGTVIGIVLAAFAYGPLVGFVERGFRPGDVSASAEEREAFEQERSLLRRAVLAFDILVLSGIGYWLGATIGG
jgi:hypothetical protein